MTPAECRAEAEKCARRYGVLMAAREYVLAKAVLAEAKEWTLKAVRIEQGDLEHIGGPAAQVVEKSRQAMLAREDQDNAPEGERVRRQS
ncbi:hypothetical protein L598_000700001180 [Mesorhizobium sp. J18]|uniref:hypothetical protein n=1 Tax=Mesorhizobium sp. J18 TaxID=935263 RepID=UPI00119905C8|nr:hypothetical protein [Mesorhizobium sp. J18]TWG90361.1 hypothetical protein L598_000700001180 [Mesorhizobium sp. J18]